jgi:hypothetical protein
MNSLRLAYAHDKFVNRTAEIQLVLGKAQQLAGRLPVEKRTVIFHGPRGAGKSWLLSEIEYQLKIEIPQALIFYLDLALFNPSQTPINKAIEAIIRQIDDKVKARTGLSYIEPNDNESNVLAERLVANVRQLDEVLVVLFDHVDESLSELLSNLENYCLSVLAVLPYVLIVLAGRGKEHVWRIPELRLKSEEQDLAYFALPETQEQLEKQVPQPTPPADQIQQLSGGYPWSNYILGINLANKPAVLEDCLIALLGDWLEMPDPPADRAHLEALCVLRAFSDEMIPPMLAAYFDDPRYLDWPYRRYRQVRQSLVGTTLVKWDIASGGYGMDQALSRVLEHWLFEAHRETWTRLHSAARDLFHKWTNDYPRTANRWQKEFKHHDGKLAHGP